MRFVMYAFCMYQEMLYFWLSNVFASHLHVAALLLVCIGYNCVWRRQPTFWHHSVSHTDGRRWKPVSVLVDDRCSAACCSDYVQQWYNWAAEGRDADALQYRCYDDNI